MSREITTDTESSMQSWNLGICWKCCIQSVICAYPAIIVMTHEREVYCNLEKKRNYINSTHKVSISEKSWMVWIFSVVYYNRKRSECKFSLVA